MSFIENYKNLPHTIKYLPVYVIGGMILFPAASVISAHFMESEYSKDSPDYSIKNRIEYIVNPNMPADRQVYHSEKYGTVPYDRNASHHAGDGLVFLLGAMGGILTAILCEPITSKKKSQIMRRNLAAMQMRYPAKYQARQNNRQR